MRKLVAAIVAVVVLIGLVAGSYATSAFRRRVDAGVESLQREIKERTRLEPRVSRVHVRWLPSPAAIIEEVNVTTRKPDGTRSVVENATVTVVPRVGALLAGRDDIERIEIKNARFTTRSEEDASALLIVPLLGAAAAPVALRDCAVRIDRGASNPAIEVHNIDVDLEPHDGAVDFRGTLSPLGEHSKGDVSGTWKPGVGRTGGDGFKIDLKVRDGDPAAVVAFAAPLKRATLTDDVTVDLSAEGFLGERTTEVMPAAPLSGSIHAETGLDILGVKHRAVFESGISLDDKRWVFSDGKGKWGERPFTYAGWIVNVAASNKVSLRLSFEHVDAAQLLAEYAIDERWRPEADVSGEIRMEGTFDYPLARYEVKMPSFRWNAWPSRPISSGPMSVRGSLLAINAEVSASFETNELKAGDLVLKNVLVGSSWWREKLTITSMNLPVWGGKLDGSAAYEPAAEQPWKGGVMLRDVDAATFVAQVVPDAGLQLEGRLDLSGDGKFLDGAWDYRGRIGVHEGTLAPATLLRDVAKEIAAAAGADLAVLDELATRHPALAADKLPFKRIAVDFKAQSPGTVARLGDLVSDGGTLTLEGTLDAAKHVAADGVAQFAPALSADLASRIAPLAKLVSADGSLRVPVHVEGSGGAVKVTLAQDFADALGKARQGKSTGPFMVEKPEPSFELGTDFPPLDEQFGR